jgi:hypothetical protein
MGNNYMILGRFDGEVGLWQMEQLENDTRLADEIVVDLDGVLAMGRFFSHSLSFLSFC